MNKIKKTALLLASSLLIGLTVQAQEMTKSVTQVISKSASKSELYDYFINKEKNQIELAYKIKETPKKLVMETYFFNLEDLSFKSSKEEEFAKEKVRYKRVKIDRKQKSDPVKLLKITNNILNGKLKLHKGYLHYWTAGRALLSKFVEEYTKEISTSQGERFVYMSHHTEMNDLSDNVSHMASGFVTIGLGNVSVIGLDRTKPYYSKYGFAIYDAHSLKEKVYKSFDLKYSFIPMSVNYLPNGDYGIIFKPFETINLVNLKSSDKFNPDPEKNFKYIQINTKGEKVVDVNFKLPTTKAKGNYVIQIIPTDKEDEIILLGMYNQDMFGAAVQIKAKWIGLQNTGDKINMYRPKKAKGLVIKIANNKIQYQKEFELDKLLSNVQLTNGTKEIEFPMQDFRPLNATTDNVGNNLITGISAIHTLFQLDNSGNITTYLDQPNSDWGVNSQFFKNSKGEIFWINTDQPKIKGESTSADIAKAQSQQTAVISKIDSKGKKIEKTISLAPTGIFIDVEEPIKMISKDEMLILGRGKKKEISLSKILLK